MMNRSVACCLFFLGALVAMPQSALADDGLNAPYDRLNLSPRQFEQIQSLENQWNSTYMQLQPQLQQAQRRLAELLAQPKSDPIEITSTQQRINQLREQLSGSATANYLRKRRLLNGGQQQQLESWMKRKLADKLKSKGM
jgi:Spy/CpxP family protein refolding chaperone